MKKFKNKNMLSVQLALAFVNEHRADFEKWLKEKVSKDYDPLLADILAKKEGVK